MTYFNKEKDNVLSVFQILLFIVQVLVVSMFLYYANIYLQQKNDFFGLNNYVLIVAGVCIYLGLRFLAGLLLAYILDFKNGHKKLVFEKMNYLNSLILWVIPFLILCVYATKFKFFFFVITFSLFVLLIVIRYVLFISNNKKLVFNDLFYFILYLCTLEIAPLIIFFKLTI